MRWLFLAVLVLGGCSAGAPPEAAASPSPALPDVASLDRITSAVFPNSEIVAYGGTIEEVGGWDRLRTKGEPLAWVIRRVGPLLDRDGLRYTQCYDSNVPFSFDNIPPGVWAGVADFAEGHWEWRDIAESPLVVADREVLGLDLSLAEDLISPAGFAYVALITLGADVPMSAGLATHWEVDSPFLAPPGPVTLTSAWGAPWEGCSLEIPYGVEHIEHNLYIGEVQLWRCAGSAFDPETAERFGGDMMLFPSEQKWAVEDDWPIPGGPYTYAAAYFDDDTQVSGWTEPLVLPQ